MSEQKIEQGDKVSWKWGGAAPDGIVAEVAKEGEVAIESHRGNTIKKTAEPDNPAVHVERPGNDVVKKASELEVEEKADGNKEEEPAKGESGDQDEELTGKDEEKQGEREKKHGKMAEANGKAKAGDKRGKEEQENGEVASTDGAAEKEDVGKADAAEPAAKKQKMNASEDKESNGKKKPGRPKKSDAPAKPKKTPKKAATETGEPRRSARHKS